MPRATAMLRTAFVPWALVLSVSALTGCEGVLPFERGDSSTSPGSTSATTTLGPFLVSVELHPGQVSPGRSLTARLSVTSEDGRSRTWTSPDAMFAYLTLEKGGHKVAMVGIPEVAAQVVTPRTVAPSYVKEHSLQATDADTGSPLAPGTYTMVARFREMELGLATLELPLIIR